MSSIKIAKIQDIESLLKVSIIRDKFSLGCDTSIHSTGIAMLSTDEENLYLVYAKLIELPKEVDTVDSQYSFKKELLQVKEQVNKLICSNNSSLIIENTFYQKNAQVLIKLSRFGGMVFTILEDLFSNCEYPNPTEARDTVGFKRTSKEDIKEQIIKFVNILGFTEKQNDICDAIVLSLSGLVTHIAGKHCCICGSKDRVTRNKKKKKYFCDKHTKELKKFGKIQN